MQPNSVFHSVCCFGSMFGEIDEEDNELYGRGFHIWNNGNIDIGHFEDGIARTGHFITVNSDGYFVVGES